MPMLLARTAVASFFFLCSIALWTPLSCADDQSIFEHSTQLFDKFYAENGWNSEGTLSGPGSTLDATHALRPGLEKFFKDYSVKSFLDIPCGDFAWMHAVDLSGISYIGMDIVSAMIEDNQRKYATADGKIRFEVGHISTTPLPAVDVIMVRDVFIHQPLALIKKSLCNIVKSGAKYALLSSYPRHMYENFDIEEGNWRPINLEIAPFGLPSPAYWIDEKCPEAGGSYDDKGLGLWSIESLRGILGDECS